MINLRGLTPLGGKSEASNYVAEVLTGGLETTIQDYSGRRGYLQYGIPRSGPMDKVSFRLGNQLLTNPESAAGLEVQFIGPSLRFTRETVIAITGADNNPQINQKPIPLWSTIFVQSGDILSFEHAKYGARTYVHFAGGLDVPVIMGSRSTFLRGELGGLKGRKLTAMDRLSNYPHSLPVKDLLGRSLSPSMTPKFSNHWEIEILIGPHDDWLTAEDINQFLSIDWRVSAKSDRVGYRLEGPPFQFSTNARKKAPDNGSHPSNKIDYGCAVGAILFCGQTPTILMADSPSLTGYMTPFTVIEASLSKVGQARPGDKLTFKLVDLNTAIKRRQLVADGAI